MKRKKDPYHTESQSVTRRLVKIGARLLLLLAVMTGCLTAGIILYNQWVNSNRGGEIVINPDLSLPEQIYLLTVINAQADRLTTPAGKGTQPMPFVVTAGESADIVAANLQAAGLISDADLFQAYIRYYGIDTQLEAGEFVLDPQMTIPEMARQLTAAVAQEATLRFIEGWRMEQMVAYLQTVQVAQIDSRQFAQIVNRQTPLDLSAHDYLVALPADASLEGYLFPDTYRVPLDADAAFLVTAMLANFGQRVTPAMRQAFGVQGLTMLEAVTLASIVEREAVLQGERAVIAGVFYNRLAQGMRLETDPTVQYALGFQPEEDTWWKSPLFLSDLEVDSPYNTYLYNGLPPGPIANPGLSALEGVAFPEKTTFLFFFADCQAAIPGTHLFSETYEEHLAYVQRCR